MLLALFDVTYVLIGRFKFLLLKFLYEYGPWHPCLDDALFLLTDNLKVFHTTAYFATGRVPISERFLNIVLFYSFLTIFCAIKI